MFVYRNDWKGKYKTNYLGGEILVTLNFYSLKNNIVFVLSEYKCLL